MGEAGPRFLTEWVGRGLGLDLSTVQVARPSCRPVQVSVNPGPWVYPVSSGRGFVWKLTAYINTWAKLPGYCIKRNMQTLFPLFTICPLYIIHKTSMDRSCRDQSESTGQHCSLIHGSIHENKQKWTGLVSFWKGKYAFLKTH